MEIKGSSYTILYSPKAIEDIAYFKRYGDASVRKKIDKLVQELETHPKTGTGKVEALRFDLAGFWSRRINDEHRLLYQINEDEQTVLVYKMRGHY